MKRFANFNQVCKEFHIGEEDRKSAPPHLKTKEEMENFFFELQQGFEDWRAMKLVVIGHGKIGKTTLLHAIKKILKQDTSGKVVSNYKFGTLY